jgi:serine/threonine-protein kinase
LETKNHAVTTSTVKVGNDPLGVAVDLNTHTAYVANYGDGTVSVIDTANHTVTGTIRVGNHLWAVAVDPVTHAAYTADSDDTVSVIEPTP